MCMWVQVPTASVSLLTRVLGLKLGSQKEQYTLLTTEPLSSPFLLFFSWVYIWCQSFKILLNSKSQKYSCIFSSRNLILPIFTLRFVTYFSTFLHRKEVGINGYFCSLVPVLLLAEKLASLSGLPLCFCQTQLRADEIGQSVRWLSCKLEDLSSIPRTHVKSVKHNGMNL